jgi:hypothetical protein
MANTPHTAWVAQVQPFNELRSSLDQYSLAMHRYKELLKLIPIEHRPAPLPPFKNRDNIQSCDRRTELLRSRFARLERLQRYLKQRRTSYTQNNDKNLLATGPAAHLDGSGRDAESKRFLRPLVWPTSTSLERNNVKHASWE